MKSRPVAPAPMRELRREEYLRYMEKHRYVTVDGKKIELIRHHNIGRYAPDDFRLQEWTVWSFPERGEWATHSGDYRGNWSPYVPRNLILRYTEPGETVCDPMMGSGTTLVECKLTGRRGIGVDINPASVMIAMNRLDFELPENEGTPASTISLFRGDARRLDRIEDSSVDLVASHPPYAGMISYSRHSVRGDISSLGLHDFLEQMAIIARECYRILRPGRHCAMLIGDTRRHRHYVPISVGVLGAFLSAGFLLKEDIIKIQHHTLSSRTRWSGHSYDFYRIAHEHLYVFRKPGEDEDLSAFRQSTRWW